jgi:hypothetical protein
MVFWWGMKEVSRVGNHGRGNSEDSWRTNTLPMPTGLAPPKHHGVFPFGRRNTVRQWLRLRYPDTRQATSGNVGLVLERGGCRQSETVQLRWHGSEEQIIEAQANFGFDHGKAVLCSNIHQRAVVNRRE